MAYVKHRVVEPPEKEPLTLAEVHAHLRLIPGDDSEDEPILLPLITTAREYCENITGCAMARQTIAAYPEAGLGTVLLPMPPIIQLESVTAYEEDGTGILLEPPSYCYDEVSGLVLLQDVPGGLRAMNPIEIRYRAGPEKVPFTMRQAMLLLVGHFYENREAVEVGSVASVEISLTVNALLNQHKVWWF